MITWSNERIVIYVALYLKTTSFMANTWRVLTFWKSFQSNKLESQPTTTTTTEKMTAARRKKASPDLMIVFFRFLVKIEYSKQRYPIGTNETGMTNHKSDYHIHYSRYCNKLYWRIVTPVTCISENHVPSTRVAIGFRIYDSHTYSEMRYHTTNNKKKTFTSLFKQMLIRS